MRKNHDRGCPWNYDYHNCSCGFLEEEVRREKKHKIEECDSFLECTIPCEECELGE